MCDEARILCLFGNIDAIAKLTFQKKYFSQILSSMATALYELLTGLDTRSLAYCFLTSKNKTSASDPKTGNR